MNRVVHISHVDGGSVSIENVDEVTIGASGNLVIQSTDENGIVLTGYAAGQWLDFTSEIVENDY